MASNFKKPTSLRNAQADAIPAAIGPAGLMNIYPGSQPANVGTAVSTQTLLVTLTTDATAFAPAASNGVLTANAITGANAVASGIAAWFRIFKADGVTAVMDGSVDVAANSPDCAIQNTSINAGQAISVTALTITESGA